MAFNKKTWTDRESQYPRRRLLTPVEEGDAVLYTVSRAEGTVTHEGDPFNAETMNNLETRIEAETNLLEQAMANVETGNTATHDYNVNDYFVKNGVFYRVTARITSGQGFNNQNCVSTTIGASLRRINDMVNNANTSISSLTSNVNGSLTRLNNEMSYGFSVRPRGKTFTFGSNLVFSGGLATKTLDCSDTLTTRANAVTVTLGGRSDEFLVASLTEAATTHVGVAFHTVRNTSFSGTFTEVGLIVWGY